MAPTIAERAANGEILYAPDLTVEQRRELLVWARDQKMGYKEIKSNYGFEESESTLRGWKRNDIVGNAPREAVFTSTDDELLDEAVRQYATGPLDRDDSYTGVWKKAKHYIGHNGGTTTAGETTLRERWNANTGYNVPPRSSSGGTQGKTGRGSATAHSTQNNTTQDRPTSSDTAGPNMSWGYYPDLPWPELVDTLGGKDAKAWVRDNRAKEEGDNVVEEEKGEGEEDEDLTWEHEDYEDFDVEGEDGADFS